MTGGTETQPDRRDAEIEGLAAELLARYEEITLLYRLSGELAGTLDVAELSDRAMHSAIEVMGCMRGAVGVLEDGLVTIKASYGELAQPVGTQLLPGARLTGRAAESGRPVVLDPDDEPPPGTLTRRRLGEAALAVPLRVDPTDGSGSGRTLGALTLIRAAGQPRFTASDVQLAEAIAWQLATRIESSRLAAELQEAERNERELELAATVQRLLLPDVPPELGGLRIAARNVPAAQVGGDLYDVFLDVHGRLWAVIADVTGHGVGSALAMATARAILRVQVQERDSPAAALRAANDALYADRGRTELLVTAFCACYDGSTGHLRFASAAQNPPLLRRADGSVEELDADGTPLGLLDRVAYEEGAVELRPGDLLLLHTDGVEEARNESGELLGIERLRALVAAADGGPDALVAAVLAEVARHAGAGARADDVTLLAVTPA